MLEQALFSRVLVSTPLIIEAKVIRKMKRKIKILVVLLHLAVQIKKLTLQKKIKSKKSGQSFEPRGILWVVMDIHTRTFRASLR